jgi:general secretion pathway protein K
VIFLPNYSTINVNTARAEILSAALDLPIQDANTLVASRKTASFRDLVDISNRLPKNKFLSTNQASTTTSYFLVEGKVHMNRARLDMLALIVRNGATTKTLWILEK